MSIRVRLALWFTLSLGVVVVALSLAASQLTSDSLLSELHRDVRQRASELVATVGPTVLAGTAEEASAGTRTIDVFSQLDVYCQVVDARRQPGRELEQPRQVAPAVPGRAVR